MGEPVVFTQDKAGGQEIKFHRSAIYFYVGMAAVSALTLLFLLVRGVLGWELGRHETLFGSSWGLCMTYEGLHAHGFHLHFTALAAVGILLVILLGIVRSLLTAGHVLTNLKSFLAAERVDLTPDLQTAATKAGLADRLILIESSELDVFSVGLLRPVVVLTTALADALSAEEVEAVLHHEKYHVQSKDPFKVMVGRILSDAFCFLPAIRSLFRRYYASKELAADGWAIKRQGSSLHLSMALLKILRSRQPVIGKVVPAVGFSGVTDLRLNVLTGKPAEAEGSCISTLWEQRRDFMVSGVVQAAIFATLICTCH